MGILSFIKIAFVNVLMRFEEKKYLKVVTEENNNDQIIFNAFYDRNFLKKEE